MDPLASELSREMPPPYSVEAGGPPPSGFIDPVMQPGRPVGQPVTVNVSVIPPNSEPVTVVVAPSAICPLCRVGVIREEVDAGITVLAVCLCICFFPIGILYLLLLYGAKEKKCSHCGVKF